MIRVPGPVDILKIIGERQKLTESDLRVWLKEMEAKYHNMIASAKLMIALDMARGMSVEDSLTRSFVMSFAVLEEFNIDPEDEKLRKFLQKE